MPTYEYLCPDGHAFELFQKMSEKPRAKCPTCGRMASRQISAGGGLVFKGSGFYITDYGKDGKGPRKEAGDQGPGDKAASEKATGDKATADLATGDKATTEKPSAEKPAPDRPHKSKGHSKKAKE
jgi:putative FmdB family regulatory protein